MCKSESDFLKALYSKILRPEIIFPCCLLLFEFYFLNTFQFNCNVDTLSYLSKALEYKSLNFREAISGYWSPLFSWLLIPVAIFVKDGLTATKILTALSCAFCLFSSIRLFRLIANDIFSSWVIAIPLTFIIHNYYCFASAPDLLAAGIFNLYLSFRLTKNHSSQFFREAIFLVLLFVAKNYYWFVCVALILLYEILKGIFYEKKFPLSALKHSAKVIALSFLLLLPWTILLSIKYSKPTFTQGAMNIDWYAQSNNSDSIKIFSASKPYSSSITFWDEPSFISHAQVQSFNAEHFIKNISNNIHTFYGAGWFTYSILFWLMVAAIAFSFLFIRKNIKHREQFLFLLLSMVIYLSGYLLITIDVRYLFQFWILLIILSGSSILLLLQKIISNKNICYTLFTLFSLSLIGRTISIEENFRSEAESKKDETFFAEKILERSSRFMLLNSDNVPAPLILNLKLDYEGIIFCKKKTTLDENILRSRKIDYLFSNESPRKYFDSNMKFDSIYTFKNFGRVYKVSY